MVGSETALITQECGRQVKITGLDVTKFTNAKNVTGVLGYVDPGTETGLCWWSIKLS